MIKGKTKSGFEFEISRRALDNYELMEVIAEADSNPLLIPKVLTMLLGKGKEELMEHVREEDGIVPTDKMLDELMDIFESSAETKN